MAPPERQGFTIVRAPGASGNSSSSSGRIRSSTGSPVSSASRAMARTELSAHWPPTKPSMVPSPSTMAAAPGQVEVGGWARTTVAWT